MDIHDIISNTNKQISSTLTEKTISVSVCTEMLHSKFNDIEQSEKCSKRDLNDPNGKYYQMTPEAIREMWQNKAAESRRYGSLIDSYADIVLNSKLLSLNAFKNYPLLEEWKLNNSYDYDKRLNGLCTGFDQFYNNLNLVTDYRFMAREQKMYIKSNKSNNYINGRFDCLFHSLSAGKYLLIDWKTNDEIKKKNSFEKMYGPMYDKEACDWNYYTVQVYMYKKALSEIYKIANPENIDVYICQFNKDPNGLKDINGNDMHYTVHKPAFEYNTDLLDDIIDFAYKKKALQELKEKDS